MKGLLAEYALFVRECWNHYQTTGAIVPSGPWLAAALARYVGTSERGEHVLEVGPGTGVVTRQIARAMRPEDRLDLVELNEQFVQRLRDCLLCDPLLRRVATRTRLMHRAVQDLPAVPTYDVIVSGLPLNNFSAELVWQILKTMTGLLRPGGVLSFFEYIGIRWLRGMVSGQAERARLRAIGRTIRSVLAGHEFRCEWVWPNVPPAWVHHARFS
ncbi:MAG: class I SAM-dependent methyltransferase [Thermoguttaceae bacterium]